jgi:hypothetical protein
MVPEINEITQDGQVVPEVPQMSKKLALFLLEVSSDVGHGYFLHWKLVPSLAIGTSSTGS